MGLLNYWTLFLLIILYLQRKKDMVSASCLCMAGCCLPNIESSMLPCRCCKVAGPG